MRRSYGVGGVPRSTALRRRRAWTMTVAKSLAVVGESRIGEIDARADCCSALSWPNSGRGIRLDGMALNRDAGAGAAAPAACSWWQQNPLLDAQSASAACVQSVALPLAVHGLAGDRARRVGRVAELLDLVGLPGEFADRYPAALSGGQRQRAALAVRSPPSPTCWFWMSRTSALDVSVQAACCACSSPCRSGSASPTPSSRTISPSCARGQARRRAVSRPVRGEADARKLDLLRSATPLHGAAAVRDSGDLGGGGAAAPALACRRSRRDRRTEGGGAARSSPAAPSPSISLARTASARLARRRGFRRLHNPGEGPA